MCGSSIESCSFSFGHLLQERSQQLEILSTEKVIVCFCMCEFIGGGQLFIFCYNVPWQEAYGGECFLLFGVRWIMPTMVVEVLGLEREVWPTEKQ